ncbi:4'-phosphopantetheinyl transferase superfamily protein [Amphritea atlantica]|uniref:4'-phosphopantetheinyl transferase superfamily protein n=1 Tax=Amphritea atlantica TaxID=355243 RepID=A0ABY5GWC9_9GAMM|nr:4'-phosphopantetheinyl transferase superfamily protein [Amphritea atlantica]
MPANNPAAEIRFWYTRTESDASENEQQLLQLPCAQQQRFKSLRHPRRRQQYLSSRFLICSALSDLFDQPLNYWQLEELPNSAPVIHNLPTPGYISLTHSKELICFALSSDRIGIDAEYPKASRDFISAAELFMNSTEQESMPDTVARQQDYFYRLWCAKEALYKALPAAEQARTTLASLVYNDLITGTGPWHLYETMLDQYHIAVVSLSSIKPDSLTPRLLRCK